MHRCVGGVGGMIQPRVLSGEGVGGGGAIQPLHSQGTGGRGGAHRGIVFLGGGGHTGV